MCNVCLISEKQARKKWACGPRLGQNNFKVAKNEQLIDHSREALIIGNSLAFWVLEYYG